MRNLILIAICLYLLIILTNIISKIRLDNITRKIIKEYWGENLTSEEIKERIKNETN